MTSNAARNAFDIDSEPARVRERYGFMEQFNPGAANRCGAPAWSQRILLARRLVEAGVRLVTVDLRWWDTHVLGFDSLRRGFLPRFDQAYSALIEDLQQRGLLESTMVIAWGEFGRTPRVNNDAGRDHYPNVFSAALAGGPIKGGRAIGASDSRGAFPRANPKTPQDVLKTMYEHLGVDTTVQYTDGSGRPHPVLPGGRTRIGQDASSAPARRSIPPALPRRRSINERPSSCLGNLSRITPSTASIVRRWPRG